MNDRAETADSSRILMLTDFYPPYVGGVARHVSNLSRELVTRGHEVAVATLGRPGLAEFEDVEGVKVFRLQGSLQRMSNLFTDPERRWAPPFPDPELLARLRRIVAHEAPTVVHAHSWIVHSFTPLKRWSGASLVVTLHEMGLRCAKKNLIFRGELCSGPGLTKCLGCSAQHYGALTGGLAAAALCGSSRLEIALADEFLPVSCAVAEGSGLTGSGLPFEVIPNFIPDDVTTAGVGVVRAADDLPKQPYLLFVGALGRHKGLHVLLEAYASLTPRIPLVLIGAPWGDTPRHFPPGVTVHENWPHERVMAAIQRSTLTIAPSIVPEASPTVVLEAMASGRPVVASHIGGVPDMIQDGENGLLTPPGDAQSLSAAIQLLVADPERRKRMGEAGRRRATAFQARAVVPRIEAVYRRVESGRGGTRVA